MLRHVRADLHIHTCLSPCGDIDMSPRAVVEQAVAKQLDVMAVCDHNTAENVAATRRAASGRNLTVLAGMEITTEEEAHLLAYFDEVDQVLELQKIVYTHFLPGSAVQMNIDDQIVANEFDEVESFNTKPLFSATSLSIDSLVGIIHRLGGLAVASHIDRESYSLIGQLGFIPGDLPLDAVEISAATPIHEARTRYAEYGHLPMITSSDAHFLHDIGRACTEFLIAEATTAEIRRALLHTEGRRVILSDSL